MKELDIHNYLKLFGVYNEKIDSQEKKIIDDFLDVVKNRKLDLNNKEDLDYFEKVFRSIFNLEISKYQSREVEFEIVDNDKFLGNFGFRHIKNKSNEYELTDLKISISKNNLSVDYLNSSVKLRLYACNQLLRGLFHEIEHYKQLMKVSSNISSLDNLRFAKEFIFSDEVILNETKPDGKYIYNLNHDSFYIENNANNSSLEKMSLLFDLYSINNVKNCSSHKLDMMLSDIRENKEFGTVYDREEYIDSKMDYVIKNNCYLLKKYPILLKQYNKKGYKRGLNDLYINMCKEINEIYKLNLKDIDKNVIINGIYKMYYELIYIKIKESNKLEINSFIRLIGEDNFNLLLSNIKESFRQDRIYKSNISRRKYDLKCICDSDLNYLKRLGIKEGIRYNNEEYPMFEYTEKFLHVKASKSIREIISNYVIPRIPSIGYYVLKDGTKILPNEFINKYLLNRLNKNMKLEDVMNVLKELVMSSREQTYRYELERINAKYQQKCNVLDNLLINNKKEALGGRVR